MFSKNREEYALLSENDYYMCNRHKLHFCNPKAIIYPTNMNKLCVVALFMKDQSDVKRFCKQTIVLNQKLPLTTYLSSGIWLIVTNENIKFTVNCQSGDTESKEVHVEAPFGILHLNNTCRGSNRYLRLLDFIDRSSTFEKSDALKSLLKLRKMTQFDIGQKFKNNFENVSKIDIPLHILQLKEIPMQTFIRETRHLPTVNIKRKTFWTFTNVVLIILFATIGVIIVMYIIKFKLKSYHSFCLKRTVGERETAITVLKLPTKDVEEESVPHNSGGGSTTYKDKTFLGQTDAVMAWPKVGTGMK